MEKGFHQFVSMGSTFPHTNREYNDWVEQETICTFPTLIVLQELFLFQSGRVVLFHAKLNENNLSFSP
jgi:hypothetical protein